MTDQMNLDFMEPKEVFLSIKPEFVELLATRKKTYEFRRYKPNEPVKRIWLYVTRPECMLKYIAEVGEPVEYPTQIPEDGIGNSDFNSGLKVSKFAYPILHLDELIEGVPLDTLRKQFHFNPPQGYIYTDTFPDLVEFVNGCEIRRLY
ncbi:hypothetical protein HYV88_05330 [Candidatus Woesearchaeota archaeon]|nr:hypothetical protein [Candidatus Woesearchaeota archaeon]